MFPIEEEQLRSLTTEDIDILIQKLNKEKEWHQRAEKNEAIDNFYKAFTRLRELGIVPYYHIGFDDGPRYLEDWIGFGFES